MDIWAKIISELVSIRAEVKANSLPPSREKALVVTKIDEAILWVRAIRNPVVLSDSLKLEA